MQKIVERAAVVDRVIGLAAHPATGNGARVVALNGPMGGGRTTVLRHLAAAAVSAGHTVYTATGEADEQDLAFGLVGQLFDRPDVPASLRDLVRLAADSPVPTSRFVRELVSNLQAPGADGSIVVCVDDVHHADSESLALLLALARHAGSGRWLIVLGELDGTRPRHATFACDLMRAAAFERIELPLISKAGIGELAALGGLDAGAVYDLTGGNPLLVQALLREQPGTAPGTGPCFADTVAALTSRMAPAMLAVTRAVAVLGAGATAEAVAELATDLGDVAIGRFEPQQVRGELDLLTAAGVLGEHGLRHPALADLVLAGLAPAVRSAAHAGAARIGYRSGSLVRVVAGHLVRCDTAPAESWVLPVLLDAAAEAEADDRAEQAVRCFELAAAICDDPTARLHTLAEVARIEWRAEPAIAARHLTTLLDGVRTDTLAAGDAVRLAGWLLWLDRRDEAAEVVAWLGSGPRAADPALRAELLSLHQRFPNHVPAGSACDAAGTRPIVPAAAAPALHAAAALDETLAETPTGTAAVSRVEHVLRGCDLSDASVHVIAQSLRILIHNDRQSLASVWCRSFLAEARRRGAQTWEAALLAVQGEIALDTGDLITAERLAAEAMERISRRSWGPGIGYPLGIQLRARVLSGQLDSAAELVRHVPEAVLGSRHGIGFLIARGWYQLATGRVHHAQADFARAGELAQACDRDLPASYPWRIGLAHAHLQLGRPGAARELMNAQQALPGGRTTRVRGAALRVVAGTVDARRRPQVLREAVDLLNSCGDRIELGFTLAELSRTHTALGEFNRARLMSRRALEVAAECGTIQLCRQLLAGGEDTLAAVDAETAAESDGPTIAIDLLSDAERRVAELAVLGQTNREISIKLFITVSTVEQHLTRVYRKLGVTRRADLPLRLQAPVTDDELVATAG